MPQSPAQRRAARAKESAAKAERRRQRARARYLEKRAKETPQQRALKIARAKGQLDPTPPPPPPSPLVAMAESALAADAIPDLRPFTTREAFPEAVGLLTAAIGWGSGHGVEAPLAVLWPRDPELVKCFRIAAGCGLFDAAKASSTSTRRDRAWLRSLDSESARVCLAILGELGEWSSATRRERAAFLLGAIIEARRAIP